MLNKILLIPSDPLEAYIKNGLTDEWLKAYFNPQQKYNTVYALTPYEEGISYRYGMIIIGAKPKEFRKWIKKIKPDVVRAYDGFKCADWACAAKIKGIPIICSVHDTSTILMNKSLEMADEIFCVSPIIKEIVTGKYKKIIFSRVKVLPNRVNKEIFYYKTATQFSDEQNCKYPYKYHILHVGRKAEEKNIDTMIKALKYMDSEYCMLFVGRGDETPYEKQAKKLGVEKRCFFIESVNNEELPLWYSWCDCMCTPSRWEGFGIVFIEAAACRSVIVTSNIEPMNQMFLDRQNAYLVNNYEKPQELAAVIISACEKNKKNADIKKNAEILSQLYAQPVVDELEVKMTYQAKDNKINYWKLIKLGICNYFKYLEFNKRKGKKNGC